jgi:multidrug efflux pump subunit AcrA (membrane-fusion protein)
MIRHLITFVLSIATVVLAGCTNEPTASTQKAVRTVVKDATAHEEPINDIYNASGTVRGRNTTVLTSKTTGYVRAVLVRSGDHVVSGQSVVQLETSDVQATVARVRAAHSHEMAAKVEAESSLDAARVSAKAAKSAFERETSLFHSESISQQQYDDAEAHWRSAAAQERMAQARVRAGESSIEEAKAALGEAQARKPRDRIT